jgi:hypothetical protein
MEFKFGDEEGPAQLESKIQDFKSRLQVAMDTDDLKAVESIFSADVLDNIDISRMRAEPLFAKATLRLLKYGKNLKLNEKALLHLREGDINSMITECSHRIGLTGLGLPGGSPSDSLLFLKDTVKIYPPINGFFSDIKEAIEYKCSLEKENRTDVYKSLSQSYHQGRLLILNNAGWLGHGLGMAVILDLKNDKTYIALTNRGEEGLSICIANEEAEELLKKTSESPIMTGTIIYETKDLLDDQFFNDFGVAKSLGGSSHHDKMDFKQSVRQHLSKAIPLIVLPAGTQAYENCTYANPKRNIEAILLIFILMKEARLNHEIMECAYHEYKIFSAHDKEQCVDMLINFHKNYQEQPGAKKEAIEAIKQLMIKVILTHHGAKEDNSELVSAQKVYKVLSDPIKEKLAKVIPEEITSPEGLTLSHHGLFSRNRKGTRKIRIVGSSEDIFNNIDALAEILKILKIYSRKEIAHINIEDDYIYIHMNNSSYASELLVKLGSVGLKDNVANIQDEIITFNHRKKTEPIISDEAILDRLKYSGIAFDSGIDFRKDLNLTKHEAESLINSGERGPIIWRSELPSMRNFLVLSFYGSRRERVVHLQFKCNEVDGRLLIKDDHKLLSIYERYKESRKHTR